MDAEHIRELFSQFRPVEVRRMFGGVGIIADGLTFAIGFEGVIYLRADAQMLPLLKQEGATPFVYPYAKGYRKRRDPDKSPFWRMPERLYDDPEEAARFAQLALDAARRKKAVKPKAVKPKAPKPKAAKSKAARAKQPAKKPVAKAIAARKKASKPKKPAKSPARRTVAAKRSSR
jgi:DNA transformation protein